MGTHLPLVSYTIHIAISMNAFKSLFASKETSVALGGSEQIVDCKITEIRQISEDTKFFKFALPNAKQLLGLPVGQHIRIVTEIDGKEVFRTYTPLKCDVPGQFDCIIKIYDQGQLTQWLNKKEVGDTVKVYGPIGLIKVENNVYTNNATKKVLATNPTVDFLQSKDTNKKQLINDKQTSTYKSGHDCRRFRNHANATASELIQKH